MRFEVSDEDYTVDNSGTFLKIRFSDRVHNRIGRCMQHVLIVRLLGQSIGYITHSKDWLALEFDGVAISLLFQTFFPIELRRLGVRTQKGCGPSMESKGAELYDPWMIVEKHPEGPVMGRYPPIRLIARSWMGKVLLDRVVLLAKSSNGLNRESGRGTRNDIAAEATSIALDQVYL
ncbi:hypothetical protein V6N11_050196 [Hibiscus sabdariffa]|uniref:Uncharacterized protein n=1 Tax=Hibiscus sabdariffa TaxID=183260 RepID=A0ABR2T963_9ROSI